MKTPSPPARDSLSVKLGAFFEAHATGWGVLAIPIVVVLLSVAAFLRIWLTGPG